MRTSTLLSTWFPFPKVFFAGLVFCVLGCQSVVLVVDPEIEPEIHTKLVHFKDDLRDQGFRVREHLCTETSPKELRAYLKRQYNRKWDIMKGAILIGDFPKPYYRYYYPNSTLGSNNCYERGSDEVIAMNFYEDLDGEFSTQHAQLCAHDSCFDTHQGETYYEIWVGVLPFHKSHAATVEGINQYLDKNHEYREGWDRPQAGFVRPLIGSVCATPAQYASQVNYFVSGDYSWDPLTRRGNLLVSVDNQLNDPLNYPNAAYAYREAMLTDAYDFGFIGAHGWYGGFTFGGGSIAIDTSYADTMDIQQVFLWDGSCNTGDLDHQPNLSSTFLYHPDNKVLFIKAATHPQGGIGVNVHGSSSRNIAQSMVDGKSAGEAFIEHVNAEFVDCYQVQRDYYLSQAILFGDPTLKLQEHMPNVSYSDRRDILIPDDRDIRGILVRPDHKKMEFQLSSYSTIQIPNYSLYLDLDHDSIADYVIGCSQQDAVMYSYDIKKPHCQELCRGSLQLEGTKCRFTIPMGKELKTNTPIQIWVQSSSGDRLPDTGSISIFLK